MRSANTAFDIVACCSALRVYQASSRTSFKTLTVFRSSGTDSLIAMNYLTRFRPVTLSEKMTIFGRPNDDCLTFERIVTFCETDFSQRKWAAPIPPHRLGFNSQGASHPCSPQRSALLINWDDRHSSQFATQE